MRLIDTHAHLLDSSFAGNVDAVLERARGAGVERVICVAVDAETSLSAAVLADSHDAVWASAGIHPNYAHLAAADGWESVVMAAKSERVIAVGETGLDRYWDDCPWEIQVENFQRHLKLSRQLGLPIIIHARDCWPEMLGVLADEAVNGPLCGVMHSFTGDREAAKECLGFGLHISFAGMLTYKKSAALREAAAAVPPSRLLVETDSPYLSPEPHRSRRPNEPAMVVHTAAVLASCLGMPLSELAQLTTGNAMRLFWPGESA